MSRCTACLTHTPALLSVLACLTLFGNPDRTKPFLRTSSPFNRSSTIGARSSSGTSDISPAVYASSFFPTGVSLLAPAFRR
eukprot:scaffold213547_cov32-Tisochrysis_lutea.AAC.1